MTKYNVLNRLCKITGCALFFIVFCTAAQSATYYVSPTGNDANDGSLSTPWKTIQKCANTMVAGDTCITRDGVYQENLVISRTGTEGRLLSFKSENRHGAVVVGSVNVRNTAHYVRVQGYKVIIPDGGNSGIISSGDHNEIIENYVTTNSTRLGLNNTALGMDGNYSLAEGNYVEKTCFGYNLNGSNNVFQNNEATRLKLNGDCGDVDYMRFFGSNHLIKNNTFHGVDMAEIGGAHVDCFQTFDNGGAQWAISNIVVEGNSCRDAHQGMMLEGKIYRQSRNLIVRNNIFSNCGTWCVCLVDIADARFLNNTCDTSGGIHGIWCRGGNNVATCEFKNNIIYGEGSLYGVLETAKLIDGNADSPGKKNLLFRPGQTITGYFGDIVNRDPMFFNREIGDYRPREGSPAIDAGMSIAGWVDAKDRDGRPRPQGSGWDIGAYEYGAMNLKPPAGLRLVEPN